MTKNLLQKISDFFSSSDSKALLENTTEISKEDNSAHAVGTGKTDKIINKKGTINLNNSTTNNYNFHIQLSPDQTPAELEAIRRQFLTDFQSGNLQFVNQNSMQNLEDCNNSEKSNKTKEIIQFFAGKISAEDLQLLRTGLFIKSLCNNEQFDRATNIKDNAIKDRRSRNVINLATAGYFESYIKPIFENNNIETATKEYEEVVRYLPEIVFVHNSMTPEDIIYEIEDKIRDKETYHLKVCKIMVNGIGKQCAQNISLAEQNLHKFYPNYKISVETHSLNNLFHCKMQIQIDNPPKNYQIS